MSFDSVKHATQKVVAFARALCNRKGSYHEVIKEYCVSNKIPLPSEPIKVIDSSKNTVTYECEWVGEWFKSQDFEHTETSAALNNLYKYMFICVLGIAVTELDKVQDELDACIKAEEVKNVIDLQAIADFIQNANECDDELASIPQ
jgi:hypothetical protein